MAATAGDGAACPAFPWPNDGAQRGRKVFMQSDCAACHSMLPYFSLIDNAARGCNVVEPKAAELVVVDEAQPAAAAAAPLRGGAYPPDLTLVTKVRQIQQGLRGNL